MSLYAQSALVAPALAPAIALAPELANTRYAYPRLNEKKNIFLAYLSAPLKKLPPQNPPHPSSRNLPFQVEAGIASRMPMRGWTYPSTTQCSGIPSEASTHRASVILVGASIRPAKSVVASEL